MTLCKRCGKETPFEGTKLCNRCWELEKIITSSMQDAVIAAKILEEMGFGIVYPDDQQQKSSTNKNVKHSPLMPDH